MAAPPQSDWSGATIWNPRAHLREIGRAPALFFDDNSLTYFDLFKYACARRRVHDRAALPESAVLALDCRDPLSAIVEMWALWLGGRCAAPLSARWTAEQRSSFVEMIGADAVVSPDRDFVPGRRLMLPFDLRGAAVPPELETFELDTTLPATIVATSGSSGRPKAAQHAAAQHLWSALGSAANIPLGVGDVCALSLPLFHVGGLAMLWRCFLGGAALLIRRGDGDASGLALDGRATHVSMVPTQLYRLLKRGSADVNPAWKAVLLGGDAAPAALIQQATAAGIPLHTTYGCTEMSSQVTTTRPAASAAELGSAGSLLPHRELALADDGEILLRGRTLFTGYRRAKDVLDAARDAEGWYHSGDLGRRDKQENLQVIGRKDNMFICGGENIQPETIERELLNIAGIVRAVVIGREDAEYGKRPFAFVESEGEINEDALRGRLRERLPGLWIPSGFAALPTMGNSMKINRRALQ